MPPAGRVEILESWRDLRKTLSDDSPRSTVWNIETTLCAYKKFKRGGQRYIGYYLDRQGVEIAQLAQRVRTGVAWQVLWQYRSETYRPEQLAETQGHSLDAGIPAGWRAYQHRRTATAIGAAQEFVLC